MWNPVAAFGVFANEPAEQDDEGCDYDGIGQE
jgi:hypothetical protein